MPLYVPSAYSNKPKALGDIATFAAGLNYELVHSKKFYDATDRTMSFAAYSTSDQELVASVGGNGPGGLLIQILYRAMWRVTSATGGATFSLAPFINGNQVRKINVNAVTSVLEYTQSMAATSAYQWVHSTYTGFDGGGVVASDVGNITTPIALAPATNQGGPLTIYIPNGPGDTFDVSIRYKATNVGASRKERRLWVRVWTLH